MDSATRGFPQGQEVKVWINPAISGARRSNTELAFNNWAAARFENNSQVTYTFVTNRPSANDYSIIVDSSTPTITGVRAEAISPTDNNGYTLQATITLDPRTGATNPAAVLDVMSHEISHPMGFDNSECDAAQSVTGRGVAHQGDYYNAVSARPTSPTACDNQKLKTNNYANARCLNLNEELNCPLNGGLWNSTTCICESHNHTGGGGGVRGPVSPELVDSCTTYYWVHYRSWDGGKTWVVVSSSYAGCW